MKNTKVHGWLGTAVSQLHMGPDNSGFPMPCDHARFCAQHKTLLRRRVEFEEHPGKEDAFYILLNWRVIIQLDLKRCLWPLGSASTSRSCI